MRIWYIDPCYLDKKRLNAAHHEIHVCESCILKGRKWGQVTEEFKNRLNYLNRNHDRLVAEISNRSVAVEKGLLDLETVLKHHPSPFIKTDMFPEGLEQLPIESADPTNEDLLRKDCLDLRHKWEMESYYYGVGRFDLAALEARLGINVVEPNAELKQRRIKNVLKKFKLWFNAYRIVWPQSRLQDRIQEFLFGNMNNLIFPNTPFLILHDMPDITLPQLVERFTQIRLANTKVGSKQEQRVKSSINRGPKRNQLDEVRGIHRDPDVRELNMEPQRSLSEDQEIFKAQLDSDNIPRLRRSVNMEVPVGHYPPRRLILGRELGQ